MVIMVMTWMLSGVVKSLFVSLYENVNILLRDVECYDKFNFFTVFVFNVEIWNINFNGRSFSKLYPLLRMDVT